MNTIWTDLHHESRWKGNEKVGSGEDNEVVLTLHSYKRAMYQDLGTYLIDFFLRLDHPSSLP
jgi:hypothetical protein